MSSLYILKKKGILLIHPDAEREPAYFLQLSVRNALNPDSQRLVDQAVRDANREWADCRELPSRVVQVGFDGVPRPGANLFKWPFRNRVYCFDGEILHPQGTLGEKELGGFSFVLHTAGEGLRREAHFTGCETGAGVEFRDRWTPGCGRREERINHRLSKILSLIRVIEAKGRRASDADLHYLGCLRQKASQLGYPSCSSA